jgi:hypothetical protein
MRYENLFQFYCKDAIHCKVSGNIEHGVKVRRQKGLSMTIRKLCHQSVGVPSMSKSPIQNVGKICVKIFGFKIICVKMVCVKMVSARDTKGSICPS